MNHRSAQPVAGAPSSASAIYCRSHRTRADHRTSSTIHPAPWQRYGASTSPDADSKTYTQNTLQPKPHDFADAEDGQRTAPTVTRVYIAHGRFDAGRGQC